MDRATRNRWARLRQQRYAEWLGHQHVPRVANTPYVPAAPPVVQQRVHADQTRVALFSALMGAEEALADAQNLALSSRTIVERVLSHLPPPPPPSRVVNGVVPLQHSLSVYISTLMSMPLSGSMGGRVPAERGVTEATFAAWPAAKQDPEHTQNHTCAVCLDPVGTTSVVFPPCGHVFDRACLWAWVQHHPTCPVCRAKATTTAHT